MPKRVLHGEGIWGSDKLARVQPEWVRPEYANLIPLALANGVFEVNAKRIWSNVYSYNRPEMDVEKVETILRSFQAAGLLFTWEDQALGKIWGYWVGIDKAGRLPNPSRLKKRHESVGPNPPAVLLREYFQKGQVGQRPANGDLGFGSDLGSGNTSSSEAIASDQQTSTGSEPSREGVELANLLHQRILQNNPSSRVTDAHVRQWSAEVDKMVRLDKRTVEHIRELIEFSQSDSFWSANILSMRKVRDKFDQLWLKRTPRAKTVVLQERKSGNQLTVEAREVYEKHGIAI